MLGYADKVLNIDLSTGKTQVKPLDKNIIDKYIGGTGYSSRVLFDEVKADADPLGPENIIIFSTGPATGMVPCSGRLDINTKSPLNRLMTVGNVGGNLGVNLKRAGYDVVIVRGISPDPVYIMIDDDKVEVRKAGHLWGKDTWQAYDQLKQELGKDFEIGAIGPAGEHMVKYASMVSNYSHAAGRCGLGAVMGSKKLKAVAFRGTRKPAVADAEALSLAGKEVADRIRKSWHPVLGARSHDRYKYDGLFMSKADYEAGFTAIKNYQTTRLDGWLENNTFNYDDTSRYPIKNMPSCYHCPTSCFPEIEITEGKRKGLKLGGFVFISSIMYFGGFCGILGLPEIWYCKEECQKLGMDYWTVGLVTGMAMELYQRGIITKADTGGIDLTWGNTEAVVEMAHQIANRRGLGDVLAEGSMAAARRIGKDATRYAYSIKGDELTGADPRQGMIPDQSRFYLTGFITANRGGDNVKVTHGFFDKLPSEELCRKDFGMSQQEYLNGMVNFFDMPDSEKKRIFGAPPRLPANTWEGKAALSKWSADLCTLLGATTFCIFPWTRGASVGPTHIAKMLTAATGKEYSSAEVMTVGERVFNLQRQYLVNCGYDAKDDDFPAKFYEEGIPDGPNKGTRLIHSEIEAFKQEYYQLRGWDKRGVPTKKKLEELGLA